MEVILTNQQIKKRSEIKNKLKDYIPNFKSISKYYTEEEIFDLILSAIRMNDFDIISSKKDGRRINHKERV